jgi:ABC-2 type transport system permease protein
VFGGIFGGNTQVSFNIALINTSNSEFANQYIEQITSTAIISIDDEVTTQETATEKMKRGELEATILLPEDFGTINNGTPTGEAKVIYTANNEQAAQTLQSVLTAQFAEINAQFVDISVPFTVTTAQINEQSLSRFDYTFAGLLGFAIIGLGIFGPVNYFPDLKKQGILRRLHTTPLKVWQYFLSTVGSQTVVGLVTTAIMLIVAVTVFDLKVVGSYLALAIFVVLSIITILGIGLAVGGWARNERQAAPLANIIVFPMMFLSGTFFPRFAMPEWLQNVSQFLPLTPVIDGIRLITTEGQTLLEVSEQIGLLTAWSIIIYFIAFRVFRWE